MKKRFCTILCLVLACLIWPCAGLTALAAAGNTTDDPAPVIRYTESLPDGGYVVVEKVVEQVDTVMEGDRSVGFVTGSSTTTRYDSSNTALCALKITGTFRYDGSTVSCTTKHYSTYAYETGWSVDNPSSTSGNSSTTKAYARANGHFVYRVLGIVVIDSAATATVYCDKDGNIS